MADDRNENPPQCPKCQSEYSYPDGILWICPECAHEWSSSATAEATEQNEVRDAHGNRLVGDDHNIDCRIESIGPMKLKSEFVKKA